MGTWLGKARFQPSRHPLSTYNASSCSVAKLCLTLCDPMDCSMPGLPVPISQNLPSESWAIEKAECRRIDAFELWCWRRLLRIPWTARRSNQSILQELNPEYSLEGLKLKLQYFGYLIWTADSSEKTPMLGKIEGRRRGRQRMRWLDGITNSMDMNLGKPIMLDPGLLAFIHVIFKTNLLTFTQLIKPQY